MRRLCSKVILFAKPQDEYIVNYQAPKWKAKKKKTTVTSHTYTHSFPFNGFEKNSIQKFNMDILVKIADAFDFTSPIPSLWVVFFFLLFFAFFFCCFYSFFTLNNFFLVNYLRFNMGKESELLFGCHK